MITLNGERGFEKVESWEDILQIPGFSQKLDPKEHELKEIIGKYIFKDHIACGLTTCRQPHGAGYIVSTKSGTVTNIGNGCGKTHFGVEFKQASRVFDRAVKEHHYRETIETFMLQLDGYLKVIDSLRSETQGADWINKHSKLFLNHNKGFPKPMVEQIQSMVRARNSAIFIERLASKEEVEEIEVIERREVETPYYKQEKIGELRGISALYPENDLRKTLVIEIQENLKTLKSLDVDSMQYKDLSYWSKWCSNFEGALNKAKEIVKSGRALLEEGNLQQLSHLLDDKNDKLLFKKKIKILKSSA